MSSSKYPNQLDTSVELPTVRDNITEIGSDVLNSFKSAIIAIERTLGVNPHGTTGNTVASRINRSLDSNGNLLPSALTQVGVLTGPITNNEVSESAAISEAKLNLNFPTHLLQDEISMLNAEIESISNQLSEIATRFAVHIHPSAINRHKALAISVDSATSVSSDLATLNLEQNDLQEVLETIYNSHINYSGADISSENNSHTAEQIFFDNTDVEEFIESNDLQGAVEDLANITTVGMVDTILNLNSNGIVRYGSIVDGYEGNEKGTILVASSLVTYTQSLGASRTVFVFSTTPTPTEEINSFDILTLSGASDEEDNIDYQIDEITLNVNDELISVSVYGGPRSAAISNMTAVIYKNKFQNYNANGLNSAVRPREDRSNTPDVQIANPNSATIISSNINPSLITSTVNSFRISIDEDTLIALETYDSSLAIQTLDSIVNKINEQAIDQRLNILAYKIRDSSCFELAIAHNIPNFAGDVANRTLRIEAATTNDGTTELGFSSVLSQKIKGYSNNDFLINGRLNSEFGKLQSLSENDIDLIVGTKTASLVSSTAVELGIRIGDLFIISLAEDSSDNGTYRICNINEGIITLDGSYSFVGALNSTSRVYILRTTAPIGELTFTEINTNIGSILFDVFIDENLDIHYSKRLEVDGELRSGSFFATIINVSKDFITFGETGSVQVTSSGLANLVDNESVSGPTVFVGASGEYTLLSNDGFSFITLLVSTTGNPNTTISIDLYGLNEISKNNFLASRGVFATSLGRILGYQNELGIPAVVDRRTFGTIDEKIISGSFVEKYIEGPRNELRGSGVIRGCQISNVQLFGSYQTFNVSSGVVVVNGIRIEFPGQTGYRVNSTGDFYIAIDAFGCLIISDIINNPDGYTADGDLTISSLFNDNVVYLAFIESQDVFDLRLLIDHIDYKLIKDIFVSNDTRFGHFSDISLAVGYAKRFSEMFPDTGTPCIYIKEGLFEISEPVIIDFDLKISGSGPSTIIRKTDNLALGSTPISSNPDPLSCVFYIGNITSNESSEIINGISIENLTYKTSEDLIHVGSFITVAERISDSDVDKFFYFKNITCIGTDNITFGGGVDASKIGEYALIVGFADVDSFVPESGTYGNIVITDCFFKSVGIEYGPCLLRDAAGITHQDIIAKGIIGIELSPNLGITTFEVFQVVTTATLSRVIEASNSISV